MTPSNIAWNVTCVPVNETGQHGQSENLCTNEIMDCHNKQTGNLQTVTACVVNMNWYVLVYFYAIETKHSLRFCDDFPKISRRSDDYFRSFSEMFRTFSEAKILKWCAEVVLENTNTISHKNERKEK